MRILALGVLFCIVISNSAQAFWWGSKRGVDRKGNCTSELIVDRSRMKSAYQDLRHEIEMAEIELKSVSKSTRAEGQQRLRDAYTKAKNARSIIRQFGEKYKGVSCMGTTMEDGQLDPVPFKVDVAEQVEAFDYAVKMIEGALSKAK